MKYINHSLISEAEYKELIRLKNTESSPVVSIHRTPLDKEHQRIWPARDWQAAESVLGKNLHEYDQVRVDCKYSFYVDVERFIYYIKRGKS